MATTRGDIFRIPYILVEFNEAMIPILNRNFQEIERRLATLQLYEKATGKPVNVEFAGRDDRITTSPADPVIAADGTAVIHTTNTDGSVDITFAWTFTGTGDAYQIDGFHVYMRSSASSDAYVIGTTPAEEDCLLVEAGSRNVVLHGLAANRWYTFGVEAYRVVDEDVDATGIKKSAIVQPSRADEDPCQPSATVTFGGDAAGTVGGVAAETIALLPDQVDALDGAVSGLAEDVAALDGTISAKFDPATGHTHAGTAGDGPPVAKVASNATTASGDEVWNAGNDGSLSGLDADTLDGEHLAGLASLLGESGAGYIWFDNSSYGVVDRISVPEGVTHGLLLLDCPAGGDSAMVYFTTESADARIMVFGAQTGYRVASDLLASSDAVHGTSTKIGSAYIDEVAHQILIPVQYGAGSWESESGYYQNTQRITWFAWS